MKSLSGRLFQSLETYLTCFSSKKEPHEKILRLAHLLRNADSETDAEKISSTLYWGEENTESALRLAQRLRNKTLECMLMDSQIHDNPFIAGYEKAVIKVHKKYAAYRLLGIGHSPVEIKEDLLSELIRTCKKYEFYPLLLSCLEQKRWAEGQRSGMEMFDKITADMDYYRDRDKAISLAAGYVLQLKIMYQTSGKINPSEVISFLTSSICDLKEQNERFDSPSILYYQKFLEMDFQSNLNNHAVAKQICEEIIHLVFAEPSLRIRQRKGLYYAQLSQYEIILEQYDEALEHARLSLDYFPKGNDNYIASKELEFFSLFYACPVGFPEDNRNVATEGLSNGAGYYLQAEECISYMLTAGEKALGKFRWAKFNLFLAYTRFMQGRNADALAALHADFSFGSAHAGWEISFRILSILIYFELGMLDEYDRQVELLRKFMSYNCATNDFGARSELILQLLRDAEKNDYDFSFPENLHQLEGGEKEYQWEFFTPELIPLHHWFRQKMNRKKKEGGLIDFYLC